MNLPDKIYNEWIKETTDIIKADMNAVQVVGELTRALKRIVNANGGTAYIVDGVSHDINGQRMPAPADVNQISGILHSFAEARLHGQRKYAGPCDSEYEDARLHDLSHSLEDWLRFAADHLERARIGGTGTLDCRDHLIKAGGLILSAVWTQDIHSGREKLSPKPAPADVCEKCNGTGWLWGHEVGDHVTDQRYACDACRSKPTADVCEFCGLPDYEHVSGCKATMPADVCECKPIGLKDFPVGTKAPAIGGGHWTKVERGWKWCTGAVFPVPGGDWNQELILPDSPPTGDVCECGHKKLMHSPLVDGELGCEACDCMKFKQKGGE